jgi:hypothetical protein
MTKIMFAENMLEVAAMERAGTVVAWLPHAILPPDGFGDK